MRSATLGATSFAAAMILLFSPTSAVAQHADTTPTFSKDIAPIFQRSCQSCHRPNSVAPMSFMTYQEVRPWARSIKNRVVLGEMPPYRYDRHIGIQDLKDDLRLNESEIDTIVRWWTRACLLVTLPISRRRCLFQILTSGPTRMTSARRT